MENKLGMFLMGLGIGAAAAILFAPQSGEEARGMISDAVDDGKNYLKKQREDLGSTADELIGKGKASAEDLIGKGKEVLNRQRENINDAVEAGKQAYHEKLSSMPEPRPV